MFVIPAIDLKEGCVVRYVQGKLDKKVYSKDPVKTAKHWARQGADLIHVVDLDGAMSGNAVNLEKVKEIVKTVGAKIQFGGGVRSLDTIQMLLDAGVCRVVLGTKAIEDEAFLKKAIAKFDSRVIVSIDALDGYLKTRGWQQDADAKLATEFVKTLIGLGMTEVIYTDISKDGTLKGPNIQGIKSLIKDTGIKVIASGGVSSLADLSKLKALKDKGVVGVIVGKALYEARFTLAEALKI